MYFLTLPEAQEAITQGQLLLYPTETFFGLGCDAHNPDAVGAVFALKQRTLDLPLPVIIGCMEQLETVAYDIPDLAQALIQQFWPGPLSLILPAQPTVPDLLIANTGHVAVRFSSHEDAQTLCRKTGKALVSSSANISGCPAALTPTDIDPRLLGKSAGVYCYGTLPAGGLPSTIAAIRYFRGQEVIQILRHGAISAEAIETAGLPVQQ